MRLSLITLFIVSFLFFPALTYSQSPREDFASAKAAFDNGKYDQCITYLEKCRSGLGGSNAKIESLKCQALVQKEDWMNAAIAYNNYDRLIPSSNRAGEAYESMLELKKNIWDKLEELEKKRKEDAEKEIKEDLATAEQEEREVTESLAQQEQEINSSNEKQLFEEATSTNDKELLDLYMMQIGTSGENFKIVHLALDKQNNPNKYLIKSVTENDMKEFSQLISFGGDKNLKNEKGETLVHLSVMNNSSRILKALVDLNAELEDYDDRGDTPLIKAVRVKNANFVTMLLEAGVDQNKTNSITKNTPFYYSLEQMEEDVVGIFINRGADVNGLFTYNYKVISPLYYTMVETKSASFGQALINHGAKVNEKNSDGSTPLIGAVTSKSKELVNMLLNNGADVNLQGPSGNTPLHYAAYGNDAEMAKYLVERAAADKKVVDQNKKTPKDIAREKGYEGVEAVLKDAKPLINTKSNYKLHEAQYLYEGEWKANVQTMKSIRKKRNGYILKGVLLIAGSGVLFAIVAKNPDSTVMPIVAGAVGGPATLVGIIMILSDPCSKNPDYKQAKRRLKEMKKQKPPVV